MFHAQNIIKTPQLPRLIAQDFFASTSSPLTITIPRAPGKLCIVFTGKNGSTPTPSLLTGFTSIAIAPASFGRIQYRFLDGSEAPTLTTTATGATTMIGLTFLIDGASTIFPPEGNIGAVGTGNTCTSTSLTLSQPVHNVLWLMMSWYASPTDKIWNQIPIGFSQRYFRTFTTLGIAATAANICTVAANMTKDNMPASSFTHNTGTSGVVYTVGIRGA